MDSCSYLLGKPQVGAILKQQFADFRVDEQLGFEPTGSGEHLWVQLIKTDITTTETARLLAQSTQSALQNIGYSGMKDRRGECSQWFSLPRSANLEGSLATLDSGNLKIQRTVANDRKLKIGTHAANRFAIRLRQCVGEREAFEQRLRALAERGVPNYFGAQRFGRNMSNITQVSEIMQHSVKADQGSESALKRLPRVKRGMLLSAARAYLFNQLLSDRIDLGCWDQYVTGDVLNLDGTARYFAVNDTNPWDDKLKLRLQSFDVHLTGLMAGKKVSSDKYASWGKAADIESRVLEKFPVLAEGLIRFGVEASRRSLRFRPKTLDWQWEESDSGGSNLLLNFELPKGAYATSLLRELCLTE